MENTLHKKALLEIKNFPISDSRTHLDIIHILQDIAEDGLAEWKKNDELVVTITKAQQENIKSYFRNHELRYPNSHAAQTTDTVIILLEMLNIKIEGVG